MLKRFFVAVFIALIFASSAHAANTTAWTGGTLNSGLSWTAVMGTTDMSAGPLASGSTVLSTVSITNGTGLDQFADFSGVWSGVTSSTPAAGSVMSLYLVPLDGDGSTYGTGELTSGSTITRAPAAGFLCSFPIQTAVATTTFSGQCDGQVIPPGTFRIAVYNNSGQTLSGTAGNSIVWFRSYNVQLNR